METKTVPSKSLGQIPPNEQSPHNTAYPLNKDINHVSIFRGDLKKNVLIIKTYDGRSAFHPTDVARSKHNAL